MLSPYFSKTGPPKNFRPVQPKHPDVIIIHKTHTTPRDPVHNVHHCTAGNYFNFFSEFDESWCQSTE